MVFSPILDSLDMLIIDDIPFISETIIKGMANSLIRFKNILPNGEIQFFVKSI